MPKSVPNYLTVDADGNVGADFTGHIHAQGLDLDAATVATPPDTDRVRWIRQSDGAVIADIAANIFGVNDVASIFLRAKAPGQNLAYLQAKADDTDPSNTALIAQASAVAQGKFATATILNALGESNFLQLTAAGKFAVAAQTDSVTFTASTQGTKTVTHGIGRVPIAAIAMPVLGSGQFLTPGVRAGTATTTQIMFQFIAGTAISATFPFYYIVIG